MGILFVLACGTEIEPIDVFDDPPASCRGDDGVETEILVHPFVQSVGPSSAWIVWETAAGSGSRVDFGLEEPLGETACGEVVPLIPGQAPDPELTQVHEVQLGELQPGTVYHYQVRTGATSSAVHHFRTVPEEPAAFQLVAMSDSQLDDRHPEKFAEVLQDGVIPYVREHHHDDLSEGLAMVLMPGDLVDNGWSIEEWHDDFFAPGRELWSQVPLYPTPGNHEGNSPLYFRYFHLPTDRLGDYPHAEHVYTTDYGNLRVIGLDSNPPYDSAEQLAWLEAVLADTCDDAPVDFVFAQLHHPAVSELWTPGESDFTADVVTRLEAFSTECGKPSIHFFGHTHAYSRGQSRDHHHLWVNVASAGGGLDRWGEQAQADYPQMSVSRDTYGFVLVEVEAGSAPRFTLRRIDRGTPEAPLDNVEADTITVLGNNAPPGAPTLAVDCAGPTLEGSAFSDPEGHPHQAAHWQVAETCTFDSVLVDRWRQDRNLYLGVDEQAGDDLTDEVVPEVSGTSFCARVRYRDGGLAWSAWSAATPGSCP